MTYVHVTIDLSLHIHLTCLFNHYHLNPNYKCIAELFFDSLYHRPFIAAIEVRCMMKGLL